LDDNATAFPPCDQQETIVNSGGARFGAMNPALDRLVLDESPDPIVVTSPSNEILYWNRAAEHVFAMPGDDALGCLLGDVVVLMNATEKRSTIEDLERSGLCVYETIHRGKDGSMIYLDVSCKTIHDPAGDVEFVLRTYKDVTDLMLERVAKSIEARFLAVLELTPDAIVIAHPSGRIILSNSQAETLFGYERAELRGQLIEILLPGRFHASHTAHRAGYFSSPRMRAMGRGLELYGVRKDGSEFPVEISLSPLQTDEGTLVMSAVRDISDRKRIEHALHEKNIELERTAEAKDRFLATMSHELRTPLNAIIGFTGTLLMKLPGPLTDEQQKQLSTIQNSARHLLSLIDDPLDLAKIDSGSAQVCLEPVDCGEIIGEVALTLRPLAERKGLSLQVQLPDQALFAQADRRALSQIVINLANNAIKFTECGGVTIVLCRRQRESKRMTCVKVIDTGCGIAPQAQSSLFNAFMQLDSSSTRAHEGTGLGLYLSAKLAKLIGGQITCESEIGNGSTFTLVLQSD
jgi:PAS domain S-box-containing protein